MRIAARAVELEVALRDEPLLADITDHGAGIEVLRIHAAAIHESDAVRLAREAGLDESDCDLPHVPRMTREDVADGRTLEQSIAARRHAHRCGHVEEFLQLRRAELLQ